MFSRTAFVLPALLALLTLSTQAAVGATIHYTFTIDGGTDFADLQPGKHTLAIYGQVTDNVLDGERNGGILQFSVNINGPSLKFEVWGCCLPPLPEAELAPIFPPSIPQQWFSAFAPPITATFRGEFDKDGYSVFAQTGSVGPSNFGNHPFTIGSEARSLLTYGYFEWDGATPVKLELVPGELTGQLIFTDLGDGTFGAGYPDRATGMTAWIGVPEPSSSIVSILLSLGLCFRRRQRA